ncbi:hypothetical protein HDV06_001846 [Boothiomyces sp. JEL0866]|nr:hypothetical protein HDV06_001846 [Boothiomyces sp. JEL0866]
MSSVPAYFIGTICAVGGSIGYAKSQSVASLIAGVSFGLLYTSSGYLLSTNSTFGYKLATVTSVLLLGAMGPKALKTAKPVSVVLSFLAIVGLVYYGKTWASK